MHSNLLSPTVATLAQQTSSHPLLCSPAKPSKRTISFLSERDEEFCDQVQ